MRDNIIQFNNSNKANKTNSDDEYFAALVQFSVHSYMAWIATQKHIQYIAKNPIVEEIMEGVATAAVKIGMEYMES